MKGHHHANLPGNGDTDSHRSTRTGRPRRTSRDYYLEVQPDEQATMRFLSEAAALVGDVPLLLEFGCGPTVHHLLPFAGRSRRDPRRRLPRSQPRRRPALGRRQSRRMGLDAVHRDHAPARARAPARRRGSCVSVRRSLASDSPPSTSPTRAVASRSASPADIRPCCAASAPTRSPTISTSGAAAPRTSPRSSRPAVGSC